MTKPGRHLTYSSDFRELVFKQYLALTPPRKITELQTKLISMYGKSPQVVHLRKWCREDLWDQRATDARVLSQTQALENGGASPKAITVPTAWEAVKKLRDNAYILLSRIEEWSQTGKSAFITGASDAKALMDCANGMLESASKMEKTTDEQRATDELQTKEEVKKKAAANADDAIRRLSKKKRVLTPRVTPEPKHRAQEVPPGMAPDAAGRGDRVLQRLGVN